MNISERIVDWHDSYAFDEEGFSEISFGELVKKIEKLGGKFVDCCCGSPYCEICNGSIDSSREITFPDGSVLYIGNPRQERFPRFLIPG